MIKIVSDLSFRLRLIRMWQVVEKSENFTPLFAYFTAICCIFSKCLRYTVFPYYARNLCFIDSLKTRTADLRILRNFLIDSTISFYNIVQLLQCTQCCTVLLNHEYEITYIFLSIFKIKNIGYLKSIDILAKLFKIYFFRSKKLFLRLYRKKSI